jgi:hypothetical protein
LNLSILNLSSNAGSLVSGIDFLWSSHPMDFNKSRGNVFDFHRLINRSSITLSRSIDSSNQPKQINLNDLGFQPRSRSKLTYKLRNAKQAAWIQRGPIRQQIDDAVGCLSILNTLVFLQPAADRSDSVLSWFVSQGHELPCLSSAGSWSFWFRTFLIC